MQDGLMDAIYTYLALCCRTNLVYVDLAGGVPTVLARVHDQGLDYNPQLSSG